MISRPDWNRVLTGSPKWKAPAREFFALVALVFAITGAHASRPAATYRVIELDGSMLAIGIVAAAYSALSALVAVPLGRMIDRRSVSNFFAIGVLTAAFGSIVLAYAGTVGMLTIGKALLGVGQIIAMIAYQAMASNRQGLARISSFARLSLAVSVGQFMGPIAAGQLIEQSRATLNQTGRVFLFSALLMGISLLIGLAAFPQNTQGRTAMSRPSTLTSTSLSQLLRLRGMPQALVASVVPLTALDLLLAYFPAIGQERGISPASVGLLLSIRALGSVASRLSMTMIISQAGSYPVLIFALLASSVGVVGVVIPLPPGILALFMFILGYGLGMNGPITMSWVSGVAPDGEHGTVLALRLLGNRIGQISMPLIAGGIASLAGPASIFALVSASLVSSVWWIHSSDARPST